MISNGSSLTGSSTLLRPIFGPNWIEQNLQFITDDDRIRGGSSEVRPAHLGMSNRQSHLDIAADSEGEFAIFHGVLDTTALGGAGLHPRRPTPLKVHGTFLVLQRLY